MATRRLPYTIAATLRPLFDRATQFDAPTVIERDGRLYGRLTLTLAAPEPAGRVPVGIDQNETNALVAVGPDDCTLFLSRKATKVANRRTSHTISRLQRKRATK